MTFMQNHIGDLQFPGDKHFNPSWAQERIDPRAKAVTTWVVFGTTICALVFALCLANFGGTPERGRAGLLAFMAGVAAVGVLLGFWAWRRWDAARSGLWRAQQDYNRAVGRQAPTAEQLQALQLGSAWDFRDKAWGHSLARFPCEREVGQLPDWRRRFAMIDPGTVADHRAALMEWWSIGTTASYREMVERLFDGLHSRGLDAAYLRSPDARSFLDHLAGVSDLPLDYVDYCIHGSVRDRGLRPPPRLWGWDLGRVAIIARGAYGAGLARHVQGVGLGANDLPDPRGVLPQHRAGFRGLERRLHRDPQIRPGRHRRAGEPRGLAGARPALASRRRVPARPRLARLGRPGR